MIDFSFTSTFTLIVLGIGVISGFINTISAGGSYITLPVLILMGVPPQVANASNRVGIVLQSIVSAVTYYRRGLLNVSKAMYLAVPCILGSFVGAYMAVTMDDTLFKRLIGIFMIVTIILMFTKPREWLKETGVLKSQTINSWEFLIFLCIGIYGGFIHAGVGAMLLSVMVLLCGFDLQRANAVKMSLSFIFNISSLSVFLFHGLVNWHLGALLAIGSMFGAWVGTHAAIRGGARFMRWALIITLLFLASRFLEFW